MSAGVTFDCVCVPGLCALCVVCVVLCASIKTNNSVLAKGDSTKRAQGELHARLESVLTEGWGGRVSSQLRELAG